MSTDKLFDEASLDDVVNAIAAINDEEPTRVGVRPDEECSLVEVEPKDNGHTLITLQDSDGNILVEDALHNINWNNLDDNTLETYKEFLEQAAEDPSTGGDAQDTILPIRSKTSEKTSSATKKTTHFTDIAQRYIQENHDAVLAEFLETSPADIHDVDDLQGDYNIEAFNNKQRLGQLRSYIENHAPDLSAERSIELREASQAYRDALSSALEQTSLHTTREYLIDQFDYSYDSRRKKGIGSLAHDIIHWQLENTDDISAKAFTSAVKDQTYNADFDDMDEETALFLRGSDDWLLYGAAHDFFESNQALLDQYNATREVVNGKDPAAENKIANGAAMIEFPSQNHGSRQILRQLTRRNWIHDEYEGDGSSNNTYAFDGPDQNNLTWHRNQSVLNHVLQREQRYMNAIGTDIIEREVARLGDTYDSEELVQASERAIIDGVPNLSDRQKIFTDVRNDSTSLEDPDDSPRSAKDIHLSGQVGTQLIANATIRAHTEGYSIDDPLRTYNK